MYKQNGGEICLICIYKTSALHYYVHDKRGHRKSSGILRKIKKKGCSSLPQQHYLFYIDNIIKSNNVADIYSPLFHLNELNT